MSDSVVADQPPVGPVAKSFRLARLLTSNISRLSSEEGLFIARFIGDEPDFGIALDWAKRLNALLRRKTVENLDNVLNAAAGTMLGRFAAGLRRDLDAIDAALELPWRRARSKARSAVSKC